MADDQNDTKTDSGDHREADESGCSGLVAGQAFSILRKRNISADSATRNDAPFICRECLSDAVVRKCAEKADHFAHHARSSPVITAAESALHNACLREICDRLKSQFPDGKWETNRPIPENQKRDLAKVVPDISGRIGTQRLVIEAQVSFLTIQQILKRSDTYTKRGIPILWIVPLKEDLGNELFRPRLFERYLHSIYFGRVYYWRTGFGAQVLPVHFGIATRHIPSSDWFDIDSKEERSAGGYDKPYKVIRRPLPATRIDLASAFSAEHRHEFIPWNERKTVPPLLIWRDNNQEWWDTDAEKEFQRRYNPAAFREE